MFSKTLAVFACAAAALAVPTLPRGLKVSISAPQQQSSLDGFKVTAAVTNSGTEDITFVNYGTVLDNKRPTQSFSVTKNGAAVPFTGIKVYLDMAKLDDAAYTTIKAGETVTVEHDVSTLYDFESFGSGNFDFVPAQRLPVVTSRILGAAPEISPVDLAGVPAASVSLSGNLARREHEDIAIAKRATVNCSNSSQASLIASSYAESKQLASAAASYTTSNPSSTLFKAYWKTNSASTVASRFTQVANENTSSRTLNCAGNGGTCSGGVIAYTVISGSRPIYFCPSWFTQPNPTSRLCGRAASQMSTAAIALHESTHAVLGTADVNYGCSTDRNLSASQQLNNADEYNCYAVEVYLATRC